MDKIVKKGQKLILNLIQIDCDNFKYLLYITSLRKWQLK